MKFLQPGTEDGHLELQKSKAAFLTSITSKADVYMVRVWVRSSIGVDPGVPLTPNLPVPDGFLKPNLLRKVNEDAEQAVCDRPLGRIGSLEHDVEGTSFGMEGRRIPSPYIARRVNPSEACRGKICIDYAPRSLWCRLRSVPINGHEGPPCRSGLSHSGGA